MNFQLANKTIFSSYSIPAWEIEDILARELTRNLLLALFCVLIVIFITLADTRICILVLMCVLFTIIDVMGVAYIWGITLDPFSLVALIVGIGLSVDYSAHIAHSFIISKGTRKERTVKGFVSIRDAIYQFMARMFL